VLIPPLVGMDYQNVLSWILAILIAYHQPTIQTTELS